MISSLKDKEGRIIAYVEWRLVGQSGFDKQDGEYVYINDIWVHGDYRMKHLLNRMTDEVMRQVPTAKYCYFQRLKRNENLRMYTRDTFQRRRNPYMKVEV